MCDMQDIVGELDGGIEYVAPYITMMQRISRGQFRPLLTQVTSRRARRKQKLALASQISPHTKPQTL